MGEPTSGLFGLERLIKPVLEYVVLVVAASAVPKAKEKRITHSLKKLVSLALQYLLLFLIFYMVNS